MAAVGSLVVFGSIIWYQMQVGDSGLVSMRNLGRLEDMAYVALVLILLGLVGVLVGLTLYLRRTASETSLANNLPFLTSLSTMVADTRSMMIFIFAGIAYGVLFGVASGTLVFRLGVLFSNSYGVGVPSIQPVVCCGPFGQMPQLVVYVTQQFAILVIPQNVILLFAISWLVGLNAAVADYVCRNSLKSDNGRWITGIGALIGLFTACPTCGGLFVLTMLGLGGAITFSVASAAFQGILVVTGIPTLLVAPVVTSRVVSRNQACAVNRTPFAR